jgi:hypothetical protein
MKEESDEQSATAGHDDGDPVNSQNAQIMRKDD